MPNEFSRKDKDDDDEALRRAAQKLGSKDDDDDKKKKLTGESLREALESKGAEVKESLTAAGAALSAEAEARLKEVIPTLETKYKDLTQRVKLPDVNETLDKLSKQVQALPQTIQQLRTEGYPFRKNWEALAGDLSKRWQEAQTQVKTFVEHESRDLREKLDDAGENIKKLQLPKVNLQSLVDNIEPKLNEVQQTLEPVEKRLQELPSVIEREIGQLQYQLDRTKWFLQQKQEASFNFQSGESIVAAAQAEWDNGKDKPDGVMFITNQRLVFEQKESVGGGLFRKGEHKQEVEWQFALSEVGEITNEDKGLFGGKDIVHIQRKSGERITIEVKGGVDSKAWAERIRRAAKGDFDGE